MARQRFTASDVVGLLECDDDEPIMEGSDDEDCLCEECIKYNKYKSINLLLYCS